MQTFLFYDIETTGFNKAFDQILQFAAIRTDLELNEIERYELKIKLNPDVIISPGALITHQMPIADMQQGMREHEAMQQIHRWMNTPNTISLGYNTLGFDDEFLRFSFYRNLLPPYTHQYANGCGRMDLYPIALLYFLYKNSAVRWPDANMKLENINISNQFITGRSHEAMTDVEVTLALARAFAKEKEFWRYTLGYFNKDTEQQRWKQIQQEQGEHSLALMIDSSFRLENSYQAPVILLGTHHHYKNQTVWLRMDLELFNTDTAPHTTKSIFKKWAEPGFILPLKKPYLEKISLERLTIAEKNHAWLKEHADCLTTLKNYFCEFTYPVHANVDIDAQLYQNGFWTSQENLICRNFVTAAPKEKARLLQSIENPTLWGLAFRILARNYPEVLSFQHQDLFTEYLQRLHSTDDALIPHDFRGEKRLTRTKALTEIQKCREKKLTETQMQLLNEFEKFCEN